MDEILSLIKDMPEFALTLIGMVLLIFAALIRLLVVSRHQAVPAAQSSTELERVIRQIAADPKISETLKQAGTDITTFSVAMLKQENENAIERNKMMPASILSKIFNDISWDVSGLIGFAVTITLVFMLVSRNIQEVPPEIFAGWTTILGFYFGKAIK